MESESLPNSSVESSHVLLDNLSRPDFYSTSQTTTKKFENIHRIGFAFNARSDSIVPEEKSVTLEYDEEETINAIRRALEQTGKKVILLEADRNFYDRVKSSDVDFVFNIAEGLQGESRESHIPAILEMLGIPYTGSGVLSQALTLSKTRTKEILDYYKIPTPRYQKFHKITDKFDTKLKFPLIVKPDGEGSSVGITNDSVVHNEKQLRRQVEYVLINFKGPALVEEFCPGREFTVGVMGNDPPVMLPIIEITFKHLPKNFVPMDSYESKWTYDMPGMNADPLICPAPIPPKLYKWIEKIALQTYSVLGCVDFCRMDIRLNKKGVPNVLELNALPGLNPNPEFHSRFPYACSVAGYSFEQMILTLLKIGLVRNGFDCRNFEIPM